MTMNSCVPSRWCEIMSDRSASSVAIPPAVRTMCAYEKTSRGGTTSLGLREVEAATPCCTRYNLPVNLDDTIVAIATPPGRGGIGIVRLGGPEARSIAAPMLRLKHDLQPGRAVFGELIEPDSPEMRIDEVVVTHFARPHSYTADDVIEISAHGSPVVLRHIV